VADKSNSTRKHQGAKMSETLNALIITSISNAAEVILTL